MTDDDSQQPGIPETEDVDQGRRGVLKAAAGAMVLSVSGIGGIEADQDEVGGVLQEHYKKMTEEEREELVEKLEKRLREEYDEPDIDISTTGPLEDTMFGYALDVDKCIGCRQCVYACMEENNISRGSKENPAANQLQWIRVLRFEDQNIDPGEGDSPPVGMAGPISSAFGDVSAGVDLHDADHFYDPETVPDEEHWYMPVQCQQCEDPSCTKVCPVQATWKEEDGIVVVDYDRCIGCKYCVTNCPYDARRFNFSEPHLPEDEINPDMHYLGNRPRPGEVVEKCTFCIQRTREGEYPACVETCPTGARKFGNLLDEESTIREILDEKPVFRLKPDTGNEPKFFYFTG
ncbi:MAG: Fe-S-cluster-containing dehydrogenase component [Halobacteriales archaeon]|jgi:Fe-S-cluster-containing dehydrogenase component